MTFELRHADLYAWEWRCVRASPPPPLKADDDATVGIGGIYFASNVTVRDSLHRAWVRFVGAPSGGAGDLIDELSVHNPHGCSHYLPVAKGRSPPQEAALDLKVKCVTALALKSDDADDDAATTAEATTAEDSQQLEIWVDCNGGNDANSGAESQHSLRTLQEAQQCLRRRSSTSIPAVVNVRGVCLIDEGPGLQLTLQGPDSNSTWRGLWPAVVSSGRVLRNWSSVSWPGAPDGRVIRASVAQWPIDVQSLRLSASIQGLTDLNTTVMIRRARFPRQQPGNYSSGWLTTAQWTPQPPIAPPYGPRLIGLRPEDFPSASIYETSPTDLYINMFYTVGEKDLNNQIARCRALFNFTAGNTPTLVFILIGAAPGVRFFLENVRETLGPGEFYVDHARSEIYVWREESWPEAANFEAVAPVSFDVVSLNGTSGVTFENLTFADVSHFPANCTTITAGHLRRPAGWLAASSPQF